ncbi:MAG: hypothetical protein SOY80_05635 [Bacilli bacterium]|nr:hypothetical protein [Bacilli bacterium]
MERGITLIETIFYIALTAVLTLFTFLIIKNINTTFLKTNDYQEVSEKLKITRLLSNIELSNAKLMINKIDSGFIISSNNVELIRYENNYLVNNLLNSSLTLKYNVITNYEIKSNQIIFNLRNSIKDDLIIMRWL